MAEETTAQAAQAERKPRRARAEGDIYAKLIAAMGDMTNAIKDTTGARGKYADLASVYSAIKPALKAHGLGMMQPATTTPEGMVCVETVVFDGRETVSSGELRIPVQSGNIAQAIGSAITYARRYSALSFFCIAADDDDGTAVAGRPVTLAAPGLVAQAQKAAQGGEESYRHFFAALPHEQQAALVQSGEHLKIKRQMGL